MKPRDGGFPLETPGEGSSPLRVLADTIRRMIDEEAARRGEQPTDPVLPREYAGALAKTFLEQRRLWSLYLERVFGELLLREPAPLTLKELFEVGRSCKRGADDIALRSGVFYVRGRLATAFPGMVRETLSRGGQFRDFSLDVTSVPVLTDRELYAAFEAALQRAGFRLGQSFSPTETRERWQHHQANGGYPLPVFPRLRAAWTARGPLPTEVDPTSLRPAGFDALQSRVDDFLAAQGLYRPTYRRAPRDLLTYLLLQSPASCEALRHILPDPETAHPLQSVRRALAPLHRLFPGLITERRRKERVVFTLHLECAPGLKGLLSVRASTVSDPPPAAPESPRNAEAEQPPSPPAPQPTASPAPSAESPAPTPRPSEPTSNTSSLEELWMLEVLTDDSHPLNRLPGNACILPPALVVRFPALRDQVFKVLTDPEGKPGFVETMLEAHGHGKRRKLRRGEMAVIFFTPRDPASPSSQSRRRFDSRVQVIHANPEYFIKVG